MSMPVAHRPPDPSGATESMLSAGVAATDRHAAPFQCSTSASVCGPGARTVRHTHALSRLVTVRSAKLSGGFPAAFGILVAVHVLPSPYQAVPPRRAQISFGLTALTSSGAAGSRTFDHPRPL